MAQAKRLTEKQLTNARVALTIEEQRHTAECNLFVESHAPPRWRGRIWAITPVATLKKGAKATIELPKGIIAEITVTKAAARGAYEFQGEGLPPSF
ncbi:MAG: hypothetical protein ACR2PL_25015 [Dehalococcoidia bacterium]